MMEYKIKAHGTAQLEIKIKYPLSSQQRVKRFRMTSVFFIPRQLGINDSSFSRERILSDFSVNTRFTTPRISMRDLIDPGCETSPLNRLKKLWKKSTKKGEWRQRADYELKTLVNIVLSATGKGVEDDIPLLNENFSDIADEIIERLTSLLKELDSFKSKGKKIKQPLVWTLEAVSSLFCEFYLLSLKEWEGDEHKADLSLKFEKSFKKLVRLRKKYGWELLVNMDTYKAERFLYRSHKLKKWSQESLYLSVVKSRASQRMGQFLLGLAAAVAMAFALGATLLSTRLFPEGSLYWALIAVAAYSVKDRMKENLRFLFLRISPFLVSDRLQRLRDPRSGKKCGKIRESVNFSDKKHLSDLTLLYRRAGKDKLSLGLMKENVLKYKKDFRIYSAPLLESHSRLEGITDIVRLDMSDWLKKMDSSSEILNYKSSNRIKNIESNRVYHVNYILFIEDRDSEVQDDIIRFRIILGQKGIVRVEELQISGMEDS